MKQKVLRRILLLALAVLLLLPVGFTLGKYARTMDVGTVTLDIDDRAILDQTWWREYSDTKTKIVLDSFYAWSDQLGLTWEDGIPVGEKENRYFYSPYTNNVRLFEVPGDTAYILAKKDKAVEFPKNSYELFTALTVEEIQFNKIDTSNVTKIDSMFMGSDKLTTLDLSPFDTSKVTDMNCMFQGCSNLTMLNLSPFDTRKVTDMNRMFHACTSLEVLDLSSFDTVSITNMDQMFTITLPALKEVTLGADFEFKGSGYIYLPMINAAGRNTKWYTVDSATGYTSMQVATYQKSKKETTTYYALKSDAVTVLDGDWKTQLTTDPTAVVVDSFNVQSANLGGKTWEDGIPVGRKNELGKFSYNVRLFEMEDGTVYILAKGDNAVTVPEGFAASASYGLRTAAVAVPDPVGPETTDESTGTEASQDNTTTTE